MAENLHHLADLDKVMDAITLIPQAEHGGLAHTCTSCPFNADFTEDAALACNLGGLPTPVEVLEMAQARKEKQ